MPATIYDIAQEAKVGIGTVSRVFNNHPSVSKETRERVLKVAAKLNYQPHPYARGLARKKTNSILVMVPFFTSFFFVEILRGVQSLLSQHECDLILHGVNQPDNAALSLKKNTLRGRVDGMLFFSMQLPEEFAAVYREQRVPVVLVDTYHKSFDSFSVENSRGAYIATDHLIKLGHKRIGMLCANLQSVPARERMEGFQQAMEEHGLSVDPRLILKSEATEFDGFSRESGYGLMNQFIAMGPAIPTAVFVSSDIQAAGALTALGERGLRCPDDVAIIGFDDIELARHIGLTTMRQPLPDMGALASRRLLERMADPTLPPIHTTFVPTLVVRRSTFRDFRSNSVSSPMKVPHS